MKAAIVVRDGVPSYEVRNWEHDLLFAVSGPMAAVAAEMALRGYERLEDVEIPVDTFEKRVRKQDGHNE